jgi:antitoxin HicB
MESLEYAVLLTPANEGGFVVTCRDLPPLITQGDDLDDALHAALDGMAEVFAAYQKKNIPFPTPSKAREGEYSVKPLTEDEVIIAAEHPMLSG